MIIALLILLNVLTISGALYIMVKLNNYFEKLEKMIQNNEIKTENLKQSLRNILVDNSFLLDDGKIKKTIMEETKDNIYNGSNLEEQNLEF